MKILLKMAWLNLWRNKGRTLILLCSMTIGLVGIIVSMGFMRGWINQMVDSSLRRFDGHVKILNPKYFKQPLIENYLVPPPGLNQQIIDDERVKSSAGRIVIQGLLAVPDNSRIVNIVGIHPAQEAAVSSLNEWIVEGAYLTNTVPSKILMGRALSKKLKKGIGKKVVLTAQQRGGEIGAGAYRIAGLFDSGSAGYDEHHVYILMPDAASMLNLETRVTETVLMLKNIADAEWMTAEINRSWSNETLQAFAWQERLPAMSKTIEFSKYSVIPYYAVFFLAMAFGILNTQLMAIGERVHEIGVLMAIGLPRKKMVSLIILESFFLALVAAVLGCSMGVACNQWLASSGIDLSSFAAATDYIGIDKVLYPKLAPIDLVTAAGITFGITILFSLYPAIKASRLKPVEAIRTLA